MTDDTIHTCSYSCERPGCIRAQRDYLAARLTAAQQQEQAAPMADVELLPCGQCGMPCRAGEYHPFAACLMFKACHNSETVRANLAPLHAENERLAEVLRELEEREQRDEALLQRALEALESADWYIGQLEWIVYSPDDTGTHEERAKVQSTIAALRERLGSTAGEVK